MPIHTSLFPISFSLFHFYAESSVTAVSRELFELLKKVRPESVVENIIAAVIVTLLTAWFAKPVLSWANRKLKQFGLAKGWGNAAKEEDYEELYLGWLKADLEERSRPLVPTLAHPNQPFDPLVKQAQRASLLLGDREDYERNPDLLESDFETRMEYGVKAPIEDLVTELKDRRKIVVLGEPGSGKSVCLRQLAYDLCEEGLKRIERGLRPRTLPIYVEMTSYDGWQSHALGVPTPVIDFLKKSLRDHSSVSEAPGTHSLIQIAYSLEYILMAGRATVIFDALDEMPPDSHQERYQTIKRFVKTHEAANGKANRFIFSCRVLDYDRSFKVDEVIIDRFDLPRINDFLWMNAPSIAEKLYKEVLKDDDLRKLVSNPFFLQAWTYVNLGSLRQHKPLLPLSRGELIKEFAQTMLADDVGIKQKKHLASVGGGLDTLRSFLADLAFALQQRREGRTSARTDSLGDVWERYPEWKLLLLIARRARILGKRAESFASLASLADADPPNVEPPVRVEFIHHRLQEYFAAEELARRLEKNEAPERYLDDIWWQETVVFAAAIVPKPGPIILRILDEQSDASEWFDRVLTSAREYLVATGAFDKPRQAQEKQEEERSGGLLNNPELVVRVFEEVKEPSELFGEIVEHGEGWRAKHLDLPVTLLFLSRIKRALAQMKKGTSDYEVWNKLKSDGNSHARRRALFVAAEAVGRLRRSTLADERRTIVRALRVVVDEGTTLHRVHALRALSFISSNQCVPVLKRGMQDRSPWAQATALSILMNMNLRQGAARNVLRSFLFARYEQQIHPKQVLNLPLLIKNFHINKGLFVSFMKSPGGKRLAFLSMRLWVAALLMSVFVAFKAAATVVFHALPIVAVAIFGALAVAAVAVFVKLPRLIISILTQPPKPRPVHQQPPRVPPPVRDVKLPSKSIRKPRIKPALLDYFFLALMFIALLPEQKLWLAVALTVYSILLAISSAMERRHVADHFRLVVRCIGTILLGLYLTRTGHNEGLVLAILVLAVVQIIVLLSLLARGIAVLIPAVGAVLLAVSQFAAGVVVLKIWPAIQAEVSPWREPTSRKQLINGAVSATRLKLLELRPRLKRMTLHALGVILFIAAAYYAMQKLNLRISDVSKLTGPELGPILISLKPYVYFIVGCALVAIPTALLLVIFHVLWDEWWIIERITIRTRSRNVHRFRNAHEFVHYAFRMVRDETRPPGVRVTVAASLAEIPLANKAYVDQLSDLAEEDLPVNVSDAVSKVADEAEKRLKRRASPDDFQVDWDLINNQLEGVWMPGEVLRPRIRKVLAALLVLPALWAIMAWLSGGMAERPTKLATFVCVVAGSSLLILYMIVARRQGRLTKWSLVGGLILLVSAFVTRVQLSLFDASWSHKFENGLVALVEVSAFSSLIVPTALAGIVARAGHTIYLLGSDETVDLELEGRPNFLQRRVHRFLGQDLMILRPVLFIALCAVFAQSLILQEYLNRRGEKLPAFAATATESEVALQSVPTDGRVVRVAMVQPDKREPAGAQFDTKTLASAETKAVVVRSLQDGGVYPLNPDRVGGDVWLTFENGKLRRWWSSPIKCLAPSAVNADTVTFDLYKECTFRGPIRLVAVVYDKKRSEFIKGMSIPELQIADPKSSSRADAWLVGDTMSPFVKSVWSPNFLEPKPQ